MNVVVFDRALMGTSLAVHIILAAIGIALPVIMLLLEYMSIRYKDNDYAVMAKRLSIVFIVFFAVGTASGMLVAVNITVLWPKFITLLYQVSSLPFYAETVAFFIESMFVVLYLYSWDKVSNGYLHMLLGIPIVIGSALTAVFITTANAFMNWPTGFDITGYLANGTISAINPYAVFYSPYAANEISHVLSSAYFAGTFIFIALFAYMALKAKDPRVKGYYVKGLKLLIVLGVIFTLASIYTGTTSISDVLNLQPEKYAALEGNLQPMANAPEVISIPLQNGSFVLFKIPYLQSILATGSPNGTVPGLSSYPLSTQPPLIVHFLFDVMVIMGFAILGLLALVAVLQVLKKKPLDNRIVLALLVVSGALALLILEDGWVMAESARQPWIVYGIMNVTAAGNASLSVIPIGGAILAFYIMVIPAAVIVIRYALRDRPLEKELK